MPFCPIGGRRHRLHRSSSWPSLVQEAPVLLHGVSPDVTRWVRALLLNHSSTFHHILVSCFLTGLLRCNLHSTHFTRFHGQCPQFPVHARIRTRNHDSSTLLALPDPLGGPRLPLMRFCPCSCAFLCDPCPLSMQFSRRQSWGGLPFPSPGSSQPGDRTPGVSHIAGDRHPQQEATVSNSHQ